MLFLRELKKVSFSISYILFVIIAVFALYSQDALNFSESKISEPEIGGNYGTKNEEVPEIIMPAALESLYAEFQENNYKTYPIGFIKNVKLSDHEQMQVAEILADITGTDADKIYSTQEDSYNSGNDISFEVSESTDFQPDDNGNFTISKDENSDVTISDENTNVTISKDKNADENHIQEESIHLAVREDLSYSEFKDLMQEADDILGGGSDYAAENLIGFGTVSLTYEEATAAYGLAKSHDKITGGYARLFSDYAVAMVFSIFPVFLAVIMGMKDKYAKISELIYTRKISGMKIVFVRYLAILTAVMLPAIILSYISNMTVWNIYSGIKLDYLTPLKYDFGWIMPSAMISIAVGTCLTELTSTPIAVAIQGLWWFIDLNMGMISVSKSYSLFRLAPRHNAGANSYFRTQDFIDNFSNLLANRLFFAGLSILLVVLTAIIFEVKRKGRLNGSNKIKTTFANIRNRYDQSQT